MIYKVSIQKQWKKAISLKNVKVQLDEKRKYRLRQADALERKDELAQMVQEARFEFEDLKTTSPAFTGRIRSSYEKLKYFKTKIWRDHPAEFGRNSKFCSNSRIASRC